MSQQSIAPQFGQRGQRQHKNHELRPAKLAVVTPIRPRVVVVADDLPLIPAEHRLAVCKPVTPPTPEALAKVAEWKKAKAEAKSGERPMFVRYPKFEKGTVAEEKIEALKSAGFVQSGKNGNNPLFTHPSNPTGLKPFEVYMPKVKENAPRLRLEAPRRSADEMFAYAPKPIEVLLNKKGEVITLKRSKRHTGKPRTKLTPEQVQARKEARAKTKAESKKMGKKSKPTSAKGKMK